MIRLITGLPGTGKSLALVAELVKLQKAGGSRPVYQCGIDGLRPGLAQECLPRNWRDLPDGAIVLVDEAQKVWPARGKTVTPSDIADLSEHRHRGLDFILATQQPSYLDWYVLGLVQEHIHIVRRWGGGVVDRYVWQEMCPSPKSFVMRSKAQRQKWVYPKECYELYKSASLHTVKRKIPRRIFAIPALLLLAVGLGIYAMRGGALKDVGHKTGAAVSTVESAGGLESSHSKAKWATPADYVVAHLPRIANQPWSAPVFDDQPVVAKPDLLCIEHENPRVPGEMLCTCYTEQVTPYDLHSLRECRTYARHGVYNPRRPPIGSGAGDSSERTADADRSDSASPPAPRAGVPVRSSRWQPEWRTRDYVQPERTRADAGLHVASGYASGG